MLDKILPRIGERYLEIVEHLEEGLRGDPERARAALTDAIGSRITLEPDESGKFLWADFGLETTPQLVAVGLPEFMVAGVGFRGRLPWSNSASAHHPKQRRIPHAGGGRWVIDRFRSTLAPRAFHSPDPVRSAATPVVDFLAVL